MSGAVESGGAIASPKFGDSVKEGRKRDRQSITMSTPGFEKLSKALLCRGGIQ